MFTLFVRGARVRVHVSLLAESTYGSFSRTHTLRAARPGTDVYSVGLTPTRRVSLSGAPAGRKGKAEGKRCERVKERLWKIVRRRRPGETGEKLTGTQAGYKDKDIERRVHMWSDFFAHLSLLGQCLSLQGRARRSRSRMFRLFAGCLYPCPVSRPPVSDTQPSCVAAGLARRADAFGAVAPGESD